MPLTACKECGNEVSTKAAACPKCGAPVRRPGSIVGGFIVLVIVGALAYALMSGGDESQDAKNETTQVALDTNVDPIPGCDLDTMGARGIDLLSNTEKRKFVGSSAQV